MEIIAGVDEVGRGPLAGPVVAAAVILSDNHDINGLRDSKKLSKTRRNLLSKEINIHAEGIGIGVIDVKTIDQINIRQATFKAMNMAVSNLPFKPNLLLVDGYPLPNQKIPNKGIVGGDDLIDSIKAASIIAKVYRDSLMEKYSCIFPEYGFEKHKGYGTVLHMDALKKYRASPIHRKSFKPIKKQLPTFKWLIKNNRIDWIGIKLSALYLFEKGFNIYEVIQKCDDYGGINIISKYNEDLIFTFVKTHYNNKIYQNKINLYNKKDYEMSMVVSKLKEKYNENCVHRFDEIKILLSKEKPIIELFKGIDS